MLALDDDVLIIATQLDVDAAVVARATGARATVINGVAGLAIVLGKQALDLGLIGAGQGVGATVFVSLQAGHDAGSSNRSDPGEIRLGPRWFSLSGLLIRMLKPCLTRIASSRSDSTRT